MDHKLYFIPFSETTRWGDELAKFWGLRGPSESRKGLSEGQGTDI